MGKKKPKKVEKVKVAAKVERVAIVSASPKRVREALRLLDARDRCAEPARIRVALKLLAMVEKFVKSGGRFKKRYRRKSS